MLIVKGVKLLPQADSSRHFRYRQQLPDHRGRGARGQRCAGQCGSRTWDYGLHGGKGAQRGAGILTQGRRVSFRRAAPPGRKGQEGVSREDREVEIFEQFLAGSASGREWVLSHTELL